MEKLKYIKIEHQDGTLSENVPIGVDADNVDVGNEDLSTKLDRLDANDASHSNSITSLNSSVINLSTQISSLASGSPAGVYATVAALTSADPDHSKIYVVTENGHWYYYNNGWQDGGTYQSNNETDPSVWVTINKNTAELKELNVKLTLQGYVRYSDGLIVGMSSENSKHTDYIFIKGYDKIKYRTNLTSGGAEIAFYDINKNYLKDISIEGDGLSNIKDIDIPENAYYVIMSCYSNWAVTAGYIKVFLTNSILSQVNENSIIVNKHKNNIEDIQNEIAWIVPQLKEINLKPELIGYVNYTSGRSNSEEKARHTDYIFIKGYETIEYKTYLTSAGAELAFYDEDKNYLKDISIEGDGQSNIKTVTVPENAYYVILSVYGTIWYPVAYLKSFISNSIIDNIKENTAEITEIKQNYENILKNKNILILGDSITDSATIIINDEMLETIAYSWPTSPSIKRWPWLIQKYFPIKECRNYAKSGATYSKSENLTDKRLSLINQVQIAINDKNNPNNIFNQQSFVPDIIIFAAGTNQSSVGSYDTAMSKTIYEEDEHTINIEETLNNLTITKEIEAARYCFIKIKQEWPMAQLFVVLPIQRMSRDQLLNSIQTELEKLAIRYGAIVINGCDNGIVQEGNTYQNSGITLSDGLHPNQNGQYLMFRQIYKAIESNYFDYSKFE